MNTSGKLSQLIAEIITNSKFRENPYFISLADGSFEKNDFIETQIQFYFAVNFFSRPMAVLAAKIPSADLRIKILRNIWDEHGGGDMEKAHGMTFRELLKRLGGITGDDINNRVLWPEVRAFNCNLIGACAVDEYLIGLGVMGMIERMFAEISAWIGQALITREWLTEDQLIHYSLHKDLDIKHSLDFFEIIENNWAGSGRDRDIIAQGLRLGEYVFSRLYEDLYRSRFRREFRQ